MKDWKWDTKSAEVTGVDDDKSVCVAKVWGTHARQVNERGRLLAAAPDLLAACERALARCPFPVGAALVKGELQAAIAKAQGEVNA